MTISRLDRREFFKALFGGLLVAAILKPVRLLAAEIHPLTLTEDDWRKRLPADAFRVLRERGTERPFSSPLVNEHRGGVYACAGCGLELFLSDAKFDSGTGWPSFYESLEGRLQTSVDYDIGIPRTEYHCAQCGGHHGHVFKDGPKPTGLRYCSNGVALKFIPKEA